MHTHAWPAASDPEEVALPNPGDYHFRQNGEAHYNDPRGTPGRAASRGLSEGRPSARPP